MPSPLQMKKYLVVSSTYRSVPIIRRVFWYSYRPFSQKSRSMVDWARWRDKALLRGVRHLLAPALLTNISSHLMILILNLQQETQLVPFLFSLAKVFEGKLKVFLKQLSNKDLFDFPLVEKLNCNDYVPNFVEFISQSWLICSGTNLLNAWSTKHRWLTYHSTCPPPSVAVPRRGLGSVSNTGFPEPETRFLAIFYYPKPGFFFNYQTRVFKKNWNFCYIQMLVILITLKLQIGACFSYYHEARGCGFFSVTIVRPLLVYLYFRSIDLVRRIVTLFCT